MKVPAVLKPQRYRLLPLAAAGLMAVVAGMGVLSYPSPSQAETQDQASVGGDAGLTLDELDYERLMEQSLKQAVDSYLGDDRSILQVRVAMSRTGGPLQSAVTAMPQAPAIGPANDAFQLPGLPGLAHLPVTSANQVPAPSVPLAAAPLVAPSLPDGLRIDRQRILLVVTKSLKQGDEDFLKTLIDQKADLNYSRGDELTVEQRQFPAGANSAEALVASGSPPVPGLPGLPAEDWRLELLIALLAVGLVGTLFALMRRKPVPMPLPEPMFATGPGPGMPAPFATAAAPVDDSARKAERDAAILRQELVVMLLEYPDLGSAFVRDLLSKEEGPRKAAIVLRTLGLQGSSRMFSGLSAEDWGRIEAEYPTTRAATADENRKAIEDAYQVMVAERAAVLSNGTGRKNSPFAFLEKLDDSQVVYILEDEGIKIKALVLSQLAIKRAAGLIRRWPADDQGAIATALGELEAVPVTAFQSIADKLAAKAEKAPSFNAVVTDGVRLLVNILDNSDNATEQRILDTLKTTNPAMMRRVKEIYFTFADIPRLPAALIKDAVREMDPVRLAAALRDTDEGLFEIVVGALTEKRRLLVLDGVEQLESRPLELLDIEEARRELVGRIRELISQGRFSLKTLAEG